MSSNEWINNGWNIATKLLSNVKPDILPCVSKIPTIVFEDKFIVFYAIDPLKKPKQEFWIIIGNLPPAIVDAKKAKDEREAIILFGELYQHDGQIIQENGEKAFMLPSLVIENKKDDKEFGKYLNNIGNYLCEMGKSFSWNEYGIKGKVFSIK
ncbi:DUF4826 family protein [Clostridium diolis]|uniref:DUF4826 family protein n=1 Tax=Clostridium diolis TaxID=223919 RepID=UPI003AF7B7A9